MAILHGCPGVKVTIVSNGQALNEYPDEDMAFKNADYSVPLSRRAMEYIECTSDTEFGIKCEITPEYKPDVPHTALRFRAFLDGKGIGGHTIKTSPSSSWSNTMSETCDRINDHEVILRKLIFKTIKKVDDMDSARVKADAKLADGLGEILVVVHRCNILASVQNSHRHKPAPRTQTTTEIAEKALKGRAISHGVGFGPDTRVHRPQHAAVAKAEYIDGVQLPLCVFRFKYRSREALQQELIIPRSPSPDLVMGPLNPRNENNANASLSKEERLAQLKREIAEIKSEVKDEEGGQVPRKRERAASGSQANGRANKASRHSRTKPIECIDLTED